MTETQDPKTLWFNFLKAFTRALTQINLYKPDHPQVKQALDDGQSLLAAISDSLGGADLSVTLDNDKLLINGTPLLTADKLPNSLKNLFTKFKIQTITFSKGATADDILALCQVQSQKGEAKDFLKERGIERITLNEAVYAKVEAAGQAAPVVTAGAAPAAAADPRVAEKLSAQPLDQALTALAGRATPDPQEQKKIVELLSSKLRQEIETSVAKALDQVRREKKKIENDMVRTESVITSMAGGVVVVDKDGNIMMMNQEAENMSGKPLAELSGKKIVDLSQIEDQVVSLAAEIKPEDAADISRDVKKAGAAAMAETFKKATAIIQNEDGKIVGAVSMPTDTAKLREVEQLQQDFMSTMTHELRSPLTSIKAALEMMGKETPDTSKGVLNTAVRNVERLNSIISDILDFSKLQSGKLVFRQEDSSAEEIAREAVDSMKAWATTKGLRLTVAAEPGLQKVYADRRRTVQVLINLISNAIKFTPNGGSIEVSADSGKEALSNYIFFSVRDTGCGIKKEDQEKVFEKFVQVASGEKVGGTGLGLAITKAMVVMQGGRMTLDSEPGRGTTFRVGMPLYRGQCEPAAGQTPAVPPPEEKPWWKKLLGF